MCLRKICIIIVYIALNRLTIPYLKLVYANLDGTFGELFFQLQKIQLICIFIKSKRLIKVCPLGSKCPKKGVASTRVPHFLNQTFLVDAERTISFLYQVHNVTKRVTAGHTRLC